MKEVEFPVFSGKAATGIGMAGIMIGREIDRKLRLTAGVLGTGTRKDLAAAFRRVNPATAFDVERANKWLQGRARPRELKLYEDWAKVLDLGRSGQWIAECDVDAFLDVVCARHGCDREALERRERDDAARRHDTSRNGADLEPDARLAGTFVSYSHAWWRYFDGRVICAELSIRPVGDPPRLIATSVQNVPTTVVELTGPVAAAPRTLNIELGHPQTGERIHFCLFRPTLLATVLVGYHTGASYLNPEAELATSRIVLIRMPPGYVTGSITGYLPEGLSLAANLTACGLPMRNPAEVDRRLTAFLLAGRDRGIDRIAADEHVALTELFDQNWLTQVAPAAARRS
jgi:hypothetical protein